jgi:HAD superfamily hydrolase (TIGR01509 family)
MGQSLPLRAVVFDLDGLMVNTEELSEEVGATLLRARGKSFTGPLLDAMMGRPTPVALQIMIDWHALDATVAQLEAETDAIFPAILDARLAPMPGLLALLTALDAAAIPKVVATSSRRTFVDDVLSRLGLTARFAFLLTAEDVVCGKPDPEIYTTACRRLELSPPQVFVLEDSENGCRAAVAAGTFAVAVPGFHSRAHSFAGARFVADSLADPRIYAALGLPAPHSS